MCASRLYLLSVVGDSFGLSPAAAGSLLGLDAVDRRATLIASRRRRLRRRDDGGFRRRRRVGRDAAATTARHVDDCSFAGRVMRTHHRHGRCRRLYRYALPSRFSCPIQLSRDSRVYVPMKLQQLASAVTHGNGSYATARQHPASAGIAAKDVEQR